VNESEFLTIVLGSGKITGRTALQKLAYFASLKIGFDLGFVAHYYGPYSTSVATASENLTTLGLVKEEVRWTTRDRRIYTYSLTEDGKTILADVESKNPVETAKVRQEINKCVEVAGNNTNVLVCAAKVHYVLCKKKGKAIKYQAVREIARSFGWDLSNKEIDSGAKLLQALGLAKKAN